MLRRHVHDREALTAEGDRRLHAPASPQPTAVAHRAHRGPHSRWSSRSAAKVCRV